MKLKLGLTLLFVTWVTGSPFPEDMYHTNNPEEIPQALRDKGYKVREITRPQTIRKALADLDPWGCDDEATRQIHDLGDFGRVAVRGRTYTETYHPGGKYYATVEDYDKACWCPIRYEAIWATHKGRQRIASHELRGGHVAIETTEIRIENRKYHIIFDKVITKWQYNSQDKTRTFLYNFTHTRADDNAADIETQVWLVRAGIETTIETYDLKRMYAMGRSQRVPAPYGTMRYLIPSFRERYAPTGFLLLEEIHVISALKMIDYGVNALYERYQWVEWEVTSHDGRNINNPWKQTNRSEPCEISEEENWGIEYERGAGGTTRVCDLHEYSLTLNASKEGFIWILPIGNFEPLNASENHDYLWRKMNKTVKWVVRTPRGLGNWFIQVVFRHGPPRELPIKIWAIMHSEDAYSKYHQTMLTPLHWKLQRTVIVKDQGDLMCERDAYYEKQRSRPKSQQDKTGDEVYQTLRIMEHTDNRKCERKYRNERQCRKNVQLAWCKEATGPIELTLTRRTVLPDIQ